MSLPKLKIKFDTRKIGGLRFIKLGRFCVSFCRCREFRRIGEREE